MTSDLIAEEAEFFSFGTNDLTQMTFGFSRDDSDKFLKPYVAQKILPGDPFESIDQSGVGKLMQISVELAKKVRPNIKLGICGETRRRAGLGGLLPPDRPQLRLLLPLPRPHRPPRRRPGQPQRRRQQPRPLRQPQKALPCGRAFSFLRDYAIIRVLLVFSSDSVASDVHRVQSERRVEVAGQ